MQLTILIAFTIISILVISGTVFVRRKLATLEGANTLWWHTDPLCPTVLAVFSCMWNMSVLQHKAHLIAMRQRQSSSDPTYRAPQFLHDVDETCRRLMQELGRSILLSNLRRSAIKEFLLLVHQVADYSDYFA